MSGFDVLGADSVGMDFTDLLKGFGGGGGGGGGGGLFSSGQPQQSATAAIEKQLAEEKARVKTLKLVSTAVLPVVALAGGLIGWGLGGRR